MSDPNDNIAGQEGDEGQQDDANGPGAEDPDALTQEDQKVYAQIMGSINRMNKKIKTAKDRVPISSKEEQEESAPKQFNSKKASVNQIAEKLIEAKQNSQIVNKEDLISDVQQTFEQMVVNVYSQNKQLKAKIESLVAIIKNQNKKINDHIEREAKLQEENEKIREELTAAKDSHVLEGRTVNKGSPVGTKSQVKAVGGKNRVNTYESQAEDYDFWSMPQNDSSAKKRKDFVADSGLWVNDKDIDKSVFLTDQTQRGGR